MQPWTTWSSSNTRLKSAFCLRYTWDRHAIWPQICLEDIGHPNKLATAILSNVFVAPTRFESQKKIRFFIMWHVQYSYWIGVSVSFKPTLLLRNYTAPSHSNASRLLSNCTNSFVFHFTTIPITVLCCQVGLFIHNFWNTLLLFSHTKSMQARTYLHLLSGKFNEPNQPAFWYFVPEGLLKLVWVRLILKPLLSL